MTTLKLGYTNPLTGTFGAHPVLGSVLDLNDAQTFTLVSPAGVTLSAPIRTLVSAGNIRSQGERGVRAVYRHNREARLSLILGPGSSPTSFIATIRSLLSWLSAPPSVPVTVQYQPFNATAPVYLDVVAAAHDIPTDEEQWLRMQLETVEILLVIRPGLRGDRLTLSNLCPNPGFEAPAGGGLATTMPQVFSDPLATSNAYTTQAGAPSLASNVLTLPGGARVSFGSPAWGAIAQWQVRFLSPNGGAVINPRFALHLTDTSNFLAAQVTGTALQINHRVAGVDHIQATTGITLVNNTWYWLRITQFPAPPGDNPYITVTLFNDSAGAVGSQVASIGAPTFDTVTALVGAPQIWNNSSNSMGVGGAFAAVHTLSLFGPGGWQLSTFTPIASMAWDGTRGDLGMSGTATAGTQTYGSGPVTSFGAVRIDGPPSSTIWNVSVTNFDGGSPTGTNAIPITAGGNVIGVSCAVKSTGFGASGFVALRVREYDASGSTLATTLIATAALNAGWATLSGTLTTNASTAYVAVRLNAGTNGTDSPNATAWLDNVQIWNQTTTGQTSMPYCELRFPNSPAQLVVSGLLGDLPAPAYVAIGTYLAALATGGSLAFALGRAGQLNPGAPLVGASAGFYGTAFSPQATAVLDALSYGGFYPTVTLTGGGWNPRAFSSKASDALGIYQIYERFLTKQSAPNLANVQTRVAAQQLSDTWYGLPAATDNLGQYTGPFSAPMSASNAWQIVSAGQVSIPPLNAGALTDTSQQYVTPRGQWVDNTGGGAVAQANWQALVPVDGSLLLGTLINPSNGPFATSNQWIWANFDGLLAREGQIAWTYSLETSPLPNPAHAGGGPGTTSSGVINVNSAADPYLTLDPGLQSAGSGNGVNQLVGWIADNTGAVLPLALEIVYTPLYLWPR